MGWSLMPNALQPFKTYCAPQTITSQLVLFLWQTVEIGPLGHVRVVEALQNFVQKTRPRDIAMLLWRRYGRIQEMGGQYQDGS